MSKKKLQPKNYIPDQEKQKKILGVLLGFEFKDGRSDLIIPSAHSFDELQYYYDQVSAMGDSDAVKSLLFIELFKKVSTSSADDIDLNGFHLMLFSCMEEVNLVLKDEQLEKVGCFIYLNERHPEKSTIRFIDFERWDNLVNGKQGKKNHEGLRLHESKNKSNKKLEE